MYERYLNSLPVFKVILYSNDHKVIGLVIPGVAVYIVPVQITYHWAGGLVLADMTVDRVP